MSIESTLTRELGIRFIDAKTIASEAKLSLSIIGYPSKADQAAIIEKSIQIFSQRSHGEQDMMQRLKSELDSIKSSIHSSSSVVADDSASSSGHSSTLSRGDSGECHGSPKFLIANRGGKWLKMKAKKALFKSQSDIL